MLFDAPQPLLLTRAGRMLLAAWATCEALFFLLVIAAWLK